eukprot:SAG22_NODE_88_length_21409_cov_11.207180_16_plen_157_part_00
MVCRWLVGLTTYLDDVGPGGGATYVWPRSHRAAHSYYRQHPGDLASGGKLNDKLSENGTQGMTSEYMDAVCGGYDGVPTEAVMDAGDLLIWHHWCVHASSVNRSDRIRQAVITRFHTTKWGDEMISDEGGVSTDGDLWKYWGRAVREAGARGSAKL